MMSVIEHFETAFDWAEAEKSGRIIPHEGVDDDFDAASGIVIEVEEQLAAYLEKQRKHFGNSSEVLTITMSPNYYLGFFDIPAWLLEILSFYISFSNVLDGHAEFFVFTPLLKSICNFSTYVDFLNLAHQN
jgi:hypothetical protein